MEHVGMLTQCCWNKVARSPNATHESNGRLKVLPWMVRLATNELFMFCKKYFGRKVDRQQMHWYQIHGLAQDCSISIANALEIPGTSVLHETIGMSVWTCVWIKRGYRLAHFANSLIDFMVSVYHWRTTQNWDGPPNHQSWVVRWATQDFAFSAALLTYMGLLVTLQFS